MLELAILGLLKERAMHGYQLKKRLADTLGGFWRVSYGSLYPALKRLQREEAVEMIFPREQVGRRKNVYRITEKGEALFVELLERAGQDASEDSGFSVRFAFFQYLKPETRIRLLERRRAFLEIPGAGESGTGAKEGRLTLKSIRIGELYVRRIRELHLGAIDDGWSRVR